MVLGDFCELEMTPSVLQCSLSNAINGSWKSSGVSRGVFWLPGNPPDHDFFLIRDVTPHRPLYQNFMTFGSPPSGQTASCISYMLTQCGNISANADERAVFAKLSCQQNKTNVRKPRNDLATPANARMSRA